MCSRYNAGTRIVGEEPLNRIQIVCLAAVLSGLSLFATPASAGNLDNVISSDYPNRILTLRHAYGGERLHLYADGTLVDDAPVGAWTTDSQLEVRDATLSGSLLTIKGRRIFEIYDSKSKQFVDALTLIPTYPEKQQKDIEKTLRRRQVEIRIEMPPTPDPKEIPETLHAVFLAPGEPMSRIAPPIYRDFFAKDEGGSSPAELPAGVLRLASISKQSAITPPHAISSPDPEYSEAARQMKFHGATVISLIVNADGSVRDAQIVVPLGAGLDDKAVEAVRHWKFEPAKKDSQAVAVAISVEVDFRLY